MGSKKQLDQVRRLLQPGRGNANWKWKDLEAAMLGAGFVEFRNNNDSYYYRHPDFPDLPFVRLCKPHTGKDVGTVYVTAARKAIRAAEQAAEMARDSQQENWYEHGESEDD